MTLNVKGDPVKLPTSSAVLSVKMSSYFYAGFLNKTIHSCELHSVSVNASLDAPVDAPLLASVNNVADDPCISYHPEKAKLNFYLLVMNGVRLVFAKTLAFNTLLTIRALIFHL